MKRVLQLQYTGISIISIDEQGRVRLLCHVNVPESAQGPVPNQDTVILEPEEAYNLYHFLSQHQDLLSQFATLRQAPAIETTLGVASYFSSHATQVQLDDKQLT